MRIIYKKPAFFRASITLINSESQAWSVEHFLNSFGHENLHSRVGASIWGTWVVQKWANKAFAKYVTDLFGLCRAERHTGAWTNFFTDSRRWTCIAQDKNINTCIKLPHNSRDRTLPRPENLFYPPIMAWIPI